MSYQKFSDHSFSGRLLFAQCTFVLVLAPFESARAGQSATTFNRDVAPIIFESCVDCHRPGGSGPFSLRSYESVRVRARQVVELTQTRKMPPWPPEAGFGHFVGEKRLSGSEIETLRRWYDEGAVEGDAADLPEPPAMTSDWELGEPDLVMSVGNEYLLPAEGRDVYRNFVAPISVSRARYVRAVEFRPTNKRVVHHAFLKLDQTDGSRALAALDESPGFGGMNIQAVMPPGNFLAWQPGTRAAEHPPGLSWRLEPGTDLVAQMHLRPTGRPEAVSAEVGFYFTDEPPRLIGERIALASLTLDIAPGETNYVVTDRFELPVDVRISAVLPHAHYLAREMKGYAILPDGSRKWLLWIRDWDFNWQGDYQYRSPVELPAGTVLHMDYRYDNSRDNPQNPSQPPVRVGYGPDSTDEMAELWFQVLVNSEGDRETLHRAYNEKNREMFVQQAELETIRHPADAEARSRLGLLLLHMPARQAEGIAHLRSAVDLDPELAEAHYQLGLWHRGSQRNDQAEVRFLEAVAADSSHAKALGNLGVIAAGNGEIKRAEEFLRRAVRADPSDDVARELLEEVRKFQAAKRP